MDPDEEPVLEAVMAGEAWAVPLPWEARDVLGPVRAIWHTLRRLLFEPHRLFDALHRSRSPWESLLFGVVVFTPGAAVLLLHLAWTDLPEAWPVLAAALLALPFLGLYRALVTGAVLWAAVGSLRGPRHTGPPPPLSVALAVAGYAQAASLLLVLGALYLPLGGLVVHAEAWLHVAGLRTACRVPWWQALLAGLLPLVLVHLGVLGVLGIWLTVSGARW